MNTLDHAQSRRALKAEDAKELKKLRAENQRLKRLLADAELDKDMLREVAKGEF